MKPSIPKWIIILDEIKKEIKHAKSVKQAIMATNNYASVTAGVNM